MPDTSSPCIGVCTIDDLRGLCLGCGRTLDEIVGWGGMTEAQRLGIMAALADRPAPAAAVVPDGGRPFPG